MKRILITVASILATIFIWGKDKVSNSVRSEASNTITQGYSRSANQNTEPLVLYKLVTQDPSNLAWHGSHTSHSAHCSHASHYSQFFPDAYKTPEYADTLLVMFDEREEVLEYYTPIYDRSIAKSKSIRCHLFRLVRFDGEPMDVLCIRIAGIKDCVARYVPIEDDETCVYLITEDNKCQIGKKEAKDNAILDIYKNDIKGYKK